MSAVDFAELVVAGGVIALVLIVIIIGRRQERRITARLAEEERKRKEEEDRKYRKRSIEERFTHYVIVSFSTRDAPPIWIPRGETPPALQPGQTLHHAANTKEWATHALRVKGSDEIHWLDLKSYDPPTRLPLPKIHPDQYLISFERYTYSWGRKGSRGSFEYQINKDAVPMLVWHYKFDRHHAITEYFLKTRVAPILVEAGNEDLSDITENRLRQVMQQYAPYLQLFNIQIEKIKLPKTAPKGHIALGFPAGFTIESDPDPVALSPERREEHVYIVGRTRSGKTTLMRSMILQDIEMGHGVAVIDPHGDLAQYILNHIPRSADTILLSNECRVPINIFRHSSEQERQIIASDVIALFKRFSDIPGARMDAILRFAVSTLTKIKGATFLDLYRLLTDAQYRAGAVQEANDPTLEHFWTHTFSSYPKDAIHPIISRLAQFKLSELLTDILGRSSTLDFYDIIESGNIFIADLSKGKMTEDNSLLLGSIIVSQIQLAAMRRANLPEDERTPYYLYVDEFQNFKTSSFPVILSEASKYGLHLTMAHQHLHQLDADTLHAVVGNVGTRIFFALGAADARTAQSYIGDHTYTELMNFDRGEAIYSPPKTQQSIKIKTTIYEPAWDGLYPASNIKADSLRWFVSQPPEPEPLTDQEEDDLWDQWEEHLRTGGDHPINFLGDDEPGPSSPPPE